MHSIALGAIFKSSGLLIALMQIFQTKWFARWAAKEGLKSSVLILAVAEMEQGLIDASLGGHVVKNALGLQAAVKAVA